MPESAWLSANATFLTRIMPDFSSLAARLAAPYTAASMGVLLVAAYLCLVNLDYAALWHDEAPAAFFGKTLLQQGSIPVTTCGFAVSWTKLRHCPKTKNDG